MTFISHDQWEREGEHLNNNGMLYLVLHHSAGSKSMSREEVETEQQLGEWKMKGIAYNWYRFKSGDSTWKTVEGRPSDIVPAAELDLNHKSVAYCLAGNYDVDAIDKAAWDGMVQDIVVICKRLGIYSNHIIGHRDVAGIAKDPSVSTACPGKLLYARLDELRTDVAHYLLGGK